TIGQDGEVVGAAEAAGEHLHLGGSRRPGRGGCRRCDVRGGGGLGGRGHGRAGGHTGDNDGFCWGGSLDLIGWRLGGGGRRRGVLRRGGRKRGRLGGV